MNRVFLSSVLAVAITSSIWQSAAADDDDDRERIDALIELLASKNEVPTASRPRPDIEVEPPAKYRKADQIIVYLAIQQLLQEGAVAFDSLLARHDDTRYSVSLETPSRVVHFSVGDVCTSIIVTGIYPYNDLGVLRNITSGQGRWHEMPLESKFPENMKKWWNRNRSDPLWKLQLRMIDHEIKFFKELDLEKAPPYHPFGKKPPIETRMKLRALNIASLEAMKAAIVATEQPYRPKSVDRPEARMTWLPWGTVSFSK